MTLDVQVTNVTSALAALLGLKSGMGVEIAPEQITIAQLEKRGKGLGLKHLVTAPTPAGAVAGGRVEEPEAVAEVLRDLIADHRLKPGPVATAIPGREAVIRLIRLPADLQADELREVVLNQEAELYLPFSRNDAFVDFQPLAAAVDPDGVKRQEVLLVAAQLSVVNSYLEALRRAGLTARVVDIASFALVRALREPLAQVPPGAAVALVLLSADDTEISILLEGVPQFSRTVSLGTREFREALESTLDLPSFKAANLSRVLGDLADEIQRSLDFYQASGTTAPVPPVAQVLLAGNGANVRQIDEFLRQRLALPVSRVDPVTALGLPEISVPPGLRSGFGVALGLALRIL
ncbi:type IV pilus biogenesis protein PilM [Gloeobacter violaceus]|uniref:type IV pilus biogenesis protein PilM n=1 Tax=Gloeobacter violaceus TaxID=33072 RepID=UPI0002D6024A|nr:type IV pilus assembly protein PilM [Gloeobacter violaceus]